MSAQKNPMLKWDVYLRNRWIDAVFVEASQDADQVRRSLVEHDGYDPGITVRPVPPTRGESTRIARRVRNPTLMVVGNPPSRRRNSAEALPEGRTLEYIVKNLRTVRDSRQLSPKMYELINNAILRVSDLQMQAAKGIHRNPSGEQLARKVLRLDYVHAEDGQEYTHDFAEDASTVTATVVEDGRKVILKAVDGRKIVKDF